MKLDLMTGAAVLFAAGAVVYAQKNSKKSVGAGIWDMLKSQRDQVGAAVPQSTAYAHEIVNTATGDQNGAGWHYYSDGTIIGPDGTYYKNGSTVYIPDSAQVGPVYKDTSPLDSNPNQIGW